MSIDKKVENLYLEYIEHDIKVYSQAYGFIGGK